ncbi:MAG TPA: OsmC family protein [Ferruginibacter sp.]|nr:OsmC family protein [Ferruginibacter sp.]
MTHSVTTIFTKGMAFISHINNHAVAMDTTSDEGGTDSAPSPKRMMLAALAGCTGMDVVSILKKQRVTFSDFTIDIDATIADEHPKIYTRVKISYKIKISPADKSKMEKAIQLSQEKYCSVSAMFRAFATLDTEIIYS